MGWWKIADVIFANGVTKEISKKVRKQKKNTQKKHRKKKRSNTRRTNVGKAEGAASKRKYRTLNRVSFN